MADLQEIKLPIDHKAKEARINKRWQKGQYPDDSTSCCVCGRKAGTHFAFFKYEGFVDPDHPQAEEGDFIGYLPIGSVCRKKLPKTHVRTLKQIQKSR